jgi:hypothetical protein
LKDQHLVQISSRIQSRFSRNHLRRVASGRRKWVRRRRSLLHRKQVTAKIDMPGSQKAVDLRSCILGVACYRIPAMPRYVIERIIPGVGNLKPEELQAISETSCGVLSKMGPTIKWIHSYVTGDKIYCIYIAPAEQTIRVDAMQGGFPANVISEVKAIIAPTTAE